MTSDNMQQIFLCPTCGAQNLVGQPSCQSCGQTFQYNCPHCSAVVNSTLVNCPDCRERLYWPTPRRVKAFPKQRETYGTRKGGKGVEAKPREKKSDPVLLGCLGLIVIVIFVALGYFIYDTFFQEEPPIAVPPPPPASACSGTRWR